MIQLFWPFLEAADAAAKASDRATALKELRRMGLDDFGLVLFTLPNGHFPNLGNVLPRMASEDVQMTWTGAKGPTLLAQSTGIVRILESIYWRHAQRSLSSAQILDFGCGYGRLLRLMYFYQDPSRVFGCDPWDRSIAICQEAGLSENIALSTYLPEDLPYPDKSFDFIYAFSVFTHLSARATRQTLLTLRRKIKDDGVVVITIRPFEYWAFAKERKLVPNPGAKQDEHNEKGFAFAPHNRAPVDGDITYGDTSMTPSYLAENFPEWKIVSVERQLADNLQLFVALRPN